MLFIVVGEPSLYWLAGLLLIVSNVAYGSTVVFYNAYLPFLSAEVPDVLAAKAAYEQSGSSADQAATSHDLPRPRTTSRDLARPPATSPDLACPRLTSPHLA